MYRFSDVLKRKETTSGVDDAVGNLSNDARHQKETVLGRGRPLHLLSSNKRVVSTNNWLSVSVASEIGRLVLCRNAICAVAIGDTWMLPNVVAIVIESTIGISGLVAGVLESIVGCGLLKLSGCATVAHNRSVKPLRVLRIDRCGRIRILWSTVSRIRRRQRSGRWPSHRVAPRILGLVASSVRGGRHLVAFHARQTLVFGNLLLMPRRVALGVPRPREFRLRGRNEDSQAFAARLGLLPLLVVEPLFPVCQPRIVILALVKIDIEAPRYRSQPLIFQSVELLHRDPAHFRPRFVLEGVVVEELASQEESNGEHTPDLTLGMIVLTLGVHHIDALREVIHAKENSRAWKPCGGENLRHKFSKSCVDRAPRHDDSGRHLRDIVGHHLNLIVEDGTHASRHCGLQFGDSGKWEGRTASGSWNGLSRVKDTF